MNYDTAFERSMGHEGGYINHPNDPGGETNWGISKRSYPLLDIKGLTRERAKIIYKQDFWDPVGSKLHPAVMYQMFDASINHGIGNTIRFLQRGVDVADDGHWGPGSQAAYGKLDINDVLFKFLAQRLRFMTKLSTFPKFGAGWSNRIADNLLYASEDN